MIQRANYEIDRLKVQYYTAEMQQKDAKDQQQIQQIEQ